MGKRGNGLDLVGYPKPLEKGEQVRLLKAAKAGDEGALWTVVLHNMRLIGRILGGIAIQGDYCEDMVHECIPTLIACVKGIDEDRLEGWSTYAWRAIKRRLWREAERYSREDRHSEYLTAEAEEKYEQPDRYEEADSDTEDKARVLAVFRTLPAGTQAAIAMRVNGMSHVEIGQAMGVSAGRVSQRLVSGMKKLRMHMGVGGKQRSLGK